MPWNTPSLATVRQNNRDYITGKLQKPLIPNDYPRVLADANAGNAHLNLQYLDWLALQLLPDTCEKQFLDKWANIFLVNADGSRGRKSAAFASGTITLNGLVAGVTIPANAQLTANTGTGLVVFETTINNTLAIGTNTIAVRALTEGSSGNLEVGTSLSLSLGISGVDASSATVVAISGGADQETDDELRVRVLERIQQPPMGGDADDYVQWALACAGVTRAWCSPLEMGMGTVTVRFMCDDLRATADPSTSGLPNADDIAAVQAFLDTVRPVAVKDIFVQAPILQKVNFGIKNLSSGSLSIDAAIRVAVSAMLKSRASPAYSINGVGQPAVNIPATWIADAVYGATNGASFDLIMSDAVMANAGCMAVLGSVTYS